MCLHGILGVSPEGLYGQVLLYPLEERLYLPAVAVQIGHVQRSYFGEVGDEDKLLAAFEVGVLHHPEGLRVEFCGLVAPNRHYARLYSGEPRSPHRPCPSHKSPMGLFP